MQNQAKRSDQESRLRAVQTALEHSIEIITKLQLDMEEEEKRVFQLIEEEKQLMSYE